MLELKDATIDDAEWLYHLRNHESVRKQSIRDNPIDKLNHYRWFIMQVDRCDKHIMVAWVDGERVGTIRSSRFVAVYTLSWAVPPEYRGKGYAKEMLKQFIAPLKGKLIATVREDNVASAKVAISAGFVFDREVERPWHVYIKEQL